MTAPIRARPAPASPGQATGPCGWPGAWSREETTNEGRGHGPGMADLFPAKTGANASYTAIVSYAGSGIRSPFETRWRVVAFEPLEVPAGKFDTVVLERTVNRHRRQCRPELHRALLARGWRLGHPAATEDGVRPGGSSLLRNLRRPR